jgi:hypothetical protein
MAFHGIIRKNRMQNIRNNPPHSTEPGPGLSMGYQVTEYKFMAFHGIIHNKKRMQIYELMRDIALNPAQDFRWDTR